MDYRRKEAEYQEAQGEFELQTEMLATMQKTFAEESTVSTMPIYPVRIHADAVTPYHRDSPRWWHLFFPGWRQRLGLDSVRRLAGSLRHAVLGALASGT